MPWSTRETPSSLNVSHGNAQRDEGAIQEVLIESAKPDFIALCSHRGHPSSLHASNSSWRRRKIRKSKHCCQYQSNYYCTCWGRITSWRGKRQTATPTWWVSRYHSVLVDLEWRPSTYYCSGWPRSTVHVWCDSLWHTATAPKKRLLESMHQRKRGSGWRLWECRDGECWRGWFGGERTKIYKKSVLRCLFF